MECAQSPEFRGMRAAQIKWPKEVPLGEHTSLGPKLLPRYHNLLVTWPDLGVSSKLTVGSTLRMQRLN